MSYLWQFVWWWLSLDKFIVCWCDTHAFSRTLCLCKKDVYVIFFLYIGHEWMATKNLFQFGFWSLCVDSKTSAPTFDIKFRVTYAAIFFESKSIKVNLISEFWNNRFFTICVFRNSKQQCFQLKIVKFNPKNNDNNNDEKIKINHWLVSFVVFHRDIQPFVFFVNNKTLKCFVCLFVSIDWDNDIFLNKNFLFSKKRTNYYNLFVV